ncbi:MAG: molybdate ABC transporter substrate-binding protein [Halieaceae bacterium]|nr:molybdate ABC transporter substrate-binding protein [Halieaceae bacterium]
MGVAANFKSTAAVLNTRFTAATGHRVTLSSASTGTLSTQIRYGAPFDIFLSADVNAAARLEADGYGVLGSRFCYAMGKLVLIGDSGNIEDLGNPDLSLAIANPLTAPYGKAAQQVLARPEFSSAGSRKLVRGNNVIQTYQYWHSAAVDLALIPLSLAPPAHTLIPQNWYTSLEQHAILLRTGQKNQAAKAYLDWLGGESAQALISDAGYGQCP